MTVNTAIRSTLMTAILTLCTLTLGLTSAYAYDDIGDVPGEYTVIDVPELKNAAQRRNAFQNRNSKASLQKLCTELYKKLKPGAKGLSTFEQLYREGKYQQALKEYRRYFFYKLKNPGEFGIVKTNFMSPIYPGLDRNRYVQDPDSNIVKANMNGIAINGKDKLAGKVGPPGTVNWAPESLKKRRLSRRHAPDDITFYRSINKLPAPSGHFAGMGIFNHLLWAYDDTGKEAYMDRWCAYVDDWTMNARDQMDNCPVNIRAAIELESQKVRFTLGILHLMVKKRPELAKHLKAPTLVRLVLFMIKERLPYTIRAKRAEQANWGIMGLNHLMHVNEVLYEFKAMDYFEREVWRLWQSNFIQHRTLDGENIESWDWGHNDFDLMGFDEFINHCSLPEEADTFEQARIWDNAEIMMRNFYVHLSPWGDYWPRFWESERFNSTRFLPEHLVPKDWMKGYFYHGLANWTDRIEDEPEVKRRKNAILGKLDQIGPPARSSDIAPYAAMYYLRESWDRDAEYLLMQNFRTRSQTLSLRNKYRARIHGSARTMYELAKNSRGLLSASSIAVDRKPDNRYLDMGTPPTGGKTRYSAQAGRHVVDTRFHASDRFDLAEARQDAPYSRPGAERGDWYGIYTKRSGFDNTPVKDVTAYRQVFSVKGDGLYFIADRLENESGKPHEYAQFFTLEVKNKKKNKNEVNPQEALIRSNNQGIPNISIYLNGSHKFGFGGKLGKNGTYKSADTVTDNKQIVSARWRAGGNQALVSTLHTRPAVSGTGTQQETYLEEYKRLNGKQGVVGSYAETPEGTEAWFMTGPKRSNPLDGGPAQADAESMLVVKQDGEISGMVLSCSSFSINGTDYTPEVSSFEYVLQNNGEISVTPIHQPIDTIQIKPQENVFTDKLEVSFDIPTQDTGDIQFRYTLDGSDPTLESRRYTGPFIVEETTRVKVRAFRKGLKETPWHFTGTDSSRTVSATFRKKDPEPSVDRKGLKRGLTYKYFEGDWPTLFTYAGINDVLEPDDSGRVRKLLDAEEVKQIRKTDMAYAIRYQGYVKVPETGVYSFKAPEHLYTTTMDAGYDLRVWVDGEEWWPNPGLHSENVWHILLEKGLHDLKVSFADYRYKKFKSEYWMPWHEEQMWQGIPVLEVSGPGFDWQPLPKESLFSE